MGEAELIKDGIAARERDIKYWEQKIKQLHEEIHFKEAVIDLYETKIIETKKAIEFLLNKLK